LAKYVFVTGGVLSSVGKGVAMASIGKLLQVRGFGVTAIKIDPYLNYDSGTMNPYIHGEVFVTEDGNESDLDLGHYERFLDINLTRNAYITTGQVYWTVIDKERRGDYLGQCVQIIPHMTDEIKRRIRLVAEQSKADLVLVEVGGTVGDIEGSPFLEAIRQMRLEEGSINTLFVHVGLVPFLGVTEEFKTKPIQHSVQELRRIGIQPDIIVARSREPMPPEPRKKIALFGSVEEKAVFYSHDVSCVYEVPLMFDEQGMGNFICERLGLPKRKPNWSEWDKILKSFKEARYDVKIAMCGKYVKLADSYVSVNEALRHAGATWDAKVHIEWIDTEKFENDPKKVESLREYDGILVPGGFGVRGTEGKILSIEYARTHGVPFLGLCLGFQLATVEFARNVCKLKRANSTEFDPHTPHPVIDLLPEQMGVKYKGATMRLGAYAIDVKPNTLASRLYRAKTIYERHRHRYEVNPSYWEIFKKQGLVFSGCTPDMKRMEMLELPSHFFFFATQFHPEFKSRPGKPDPAFYGFIKAALDKQLGKSKIAVGEEKIQYAAATTL